MLDPKYVVMRRKVCVGLNHILPGGSGQNLRIVLFLAGIRAGFPANDKQEYVIVSLF
jgi:hypothetical protein